MQILFVYGSGNPEIANCDGPYINLVSDKDVCSSIEEKGEQTYTANFYNKENLLTILRDDEISNDIKQIINKIPNSICSFNPIEFENTMISLLNISK
jgi:hypothetical protein